MSDWSKGTLSDLVAEPSGIKSGPFGTVLSASEYTNSGVPVVSVGEVGYGELRIRDETPRVGDAVTARLPEFILREGDIVLGRKGAVDRSAWVSASEAGWFLGSDGLRVRVRDDVDSRFVAFQLRGREAREWLRQHAGGSTLLSLNQATLGRVPVVIPPLAEQQAIAEALGAFDDKIAANKALVSKARELGVAMLDIEGPTTALGNVVIHRKAQVNPAQLSEPLVEHFSLPAFDLGEGPEIVAPSTIKSSKFTVDSPALLVSKLNPSTPRIWPVSAGNTRPRLASTEFLVLEPTVCDPWVMWALAARPSFTLELGRKVAGTSGSHQRVRPEEVLATAILDPRAIPPQLIADVGEVLAPIASLERENRTLVETRNALLPHLMSGRLRVRDVATATPTGGGESDDDD